MSDVSGAIRVKDLVLSYMGADDFERITKNPYVQINEGHFQSAEILLWEKSLLDAAIKGRDAFSEMPKFPAFLCGKVMFWMVPRDVMGGIWDDIPDGGEVPVIFVFFDPGGHLCAIWRVVSYPDGQYKWGGAMFSKGRYDHLCLHPHDASETERSQMPAGQAVIAAAMFLGLPFIDIEERYASRPDRRRAERLGNPLPSVQTVVLRRAEKRKSTDTHGGIIEYSCQWLVKGHWRKLHEPRKADGATVTYVQPYAKGPEDMPFRAPRETVFVAKR